MVTVAPAVYRALNETTLSTETWVQLCQRPSNSVALSLIVKAVALVLIFGAAGARVDTVLGFEVLGKLVNIDGLNITADGVLHLHPVARILESNPLNPVLVLSYNKRSGCGNRARSSIGIDVRTSRRTRVHVWCTDRWPLRRCLRGAT